MWMVFWSLHANQATKSEFITQLNLYIGLLLLFFFFFQFIASLKNVVKSFELSSWVSFLLGCQQKALKYLASNPPLRNYFDLEKHPHQILHWVFFSPILNVSLLKEMPCDLACWFCVGFFFPNWKKLWWPLHQSRSSSHLCWMCSWQERGELVTVLLGPWGQSSLVPGRALGELDPLQMQAGIPCWTIPGIWWRRRTTPPQSQPSPVFVLCFLVSPDNWEPTAAPPGSPGVCLARRNSSPGESCGNSIKWVVSAKVSCELLWFECGFVNPFPSRRFGRWGSLHVEEGKILMVNFEKLVCAFDLKYKQDAEHAPGMGTVSFSQWPHL